jgi:alkylation response protein AidB-like acyl-CoA dehydrogenase
VTAQTQTIPAAPTVDRALARRFTDEHIVGVADRFDRAGRVPDDLLLLLSEAGLWAPFLPSSMGGRDVSFTELGGIHEEIGRGCSSIRSLLTVHTMLAWTVNRWGTPAQRDRWLPPLAAGELIGAVAITEPGAGSDTANLSATATRTPDGWRLSGTKKWITGGQRADLFLVYARTDHGLGAFLVPRTAPGIEVEPIGEILGTRASMLATIRLRDAEVDADAMVGPDSFMSGMVLTGMLDIGRFSVAAGSLGIIQACLDASSRYTSSRTVGGVRLRDLQLTQAKVSDMVTDAAAARLLVDRAGRLKDAGDPETIIATWIAKYFASTAAARHASAAVQIHGANGCGPDYPVARLYRDAKVMEIIEASTEIQQITIARSAYQNTSTRR